MATKTWRWTIKNGPSELDLFVLGLARRQSVEFLCGYSGGDHLTFLAIINSIKAEDGSGKNWLIEGYVQKDWRMPLGGCMRRETNKHIGKFKMFFSYKQNRTGWVELKDS
jgi:hypothetical protein